jgi:plastocyanin
MSTLERPTLPAAEATDRRSLPWTRLLAWTAGVGAAVDVAFLTLIGEVIPPIAIGAVLSVVGIALLRSRHRLGIGLLGVVGVLLLVSGAPFSAPHLAHPESAIDFIHATSYLGTRLVMTVAAVGAWRQSSPLAARRLGAVTAVGLVAAVVVATISFTTRSSDTAEAGDVLVDVRDFEFPDELRVPPGGAVFVDNTDLVRHTFTVEGTGISRELPARTGVRIPLDLPPGTYELRCAVPGHDSMEADLVVG